MLAGFNGLHERFDGWLCVSVLALVFGLFGRAAWSLTLAGAGLIAGLYGLTDVRPPLLVACGIAALYAFALWSARVSRGVPPAELDPDDPPGDEAVGTLFILVPAFRGRMSDLDEVERVIREERPDAVIRRLRYPSRVFSNASPLDIAEGLSDAIERLVEGDPARYGSIVLVGFSLGALMVRKAFLYGLNRAEDFPGWCEATPAREWVGRVERIILLAGTNRGWTLENYRGEMSRPAWLLTRMALEFSRRLGVNRLILDCERGSPFVANLRIQWIRACRDREARASGDPAAGETKWPTVVQLLGSEDEVVSEEDHRDLVASRDFIFLRVLGTRHAEIVDFRDPAFGKGREDAFRKAVACDSETLRAEHPATTRDEAPEVRRVVFVLHGIRDIGVWTDQVQKDLERHLDQAPGDAGRLLVIRPSYGRFALAPFLMARDRQRKVRWFMDRYTEIVAKCPNADAIDFIGHSNGTYILASALERYRSLRVNQVVFAGSVVPQDYDWQSRFDAKQVEAVRNYVGSDDRVVATFPGLFEFFNSREIGTAGFNGFTQHAGNQMQVRFIQGGHSCALAPANLPSILAFLKDGSLTNSAPTCGEQAGWATRLHKYCLPVCLGIVLLVLLLGSILVGLAFFVSTRAFPPPLTGPAFAWLAGGLLAGYIGLLALILYRY